MSKLKIIYNQEYDIKRVKETIAKIDWFVENGYNYKNFSFPKSLDKEKLKGYSDEEIENAVIAEYDDVSYKTNEIFLAGNWEKVSRELSLALLNSSLFDQEEYIINLTKYGTGGSYNLPNTVIINVSFNYNLGLLRTIMHEIIHLSIQKYIDEYKIGQWQKERIVDLFFIKNFPKRIKMGNVYMSINTDKIDQVFDQNFPDMRAIVEKSSKNN